MVLSQMLGWRNLHVTLFRCPDKKVGLISASGERFLRARLQPLPSLTLSPGSSARAGPARVVAFRSNQHSLS